MISGVQKLFSATHNVSRSFGSRDQKRADTIFNELCSQFIEIPHSTKTVVKDHPRGRVITFTLLFGTNQTDVEKLRSFIGLVSNITMTHMAIYNLEKSISADMVRAESIVNNLDAKGAKSIIKVKAKEHIKLC